MKRTIFHCSKNILPILLSCLLMSIFPLASKGQFSYSRGYIITNENDTLHGFISDRGDIGNATVCKFKESKQSKPTKYHPGEIRSYRFDDGNFYVSIEVVNKGEKKPAFTEVLLDGEIGLLYYCKNEELSYFIRKENGSIVGLPNEILTLRKRTHININASLQSSAANFMIDSYKDSLETVFKNCNAIKPLIEELEYEARPLIDISKEYINCICNKDRCITYEKNIRKISPTFGVYSGVHLSQVNLLESSIRSNMEVSIPVGIFFNVPIPLLNEKISFQAELQARKLNYPDFSNIPDIYTEINLSSTQLSIPLSIRYSFYPKKLKPSIGIGKEFAYSFNTKVNTIPTEDFPDGFIKDYRAQGFFTHYYSKGGWFVDLGADYRLSSKLSIYSNLRFSTCLNLIIEEKNYGNFSFNNAAEKNTLNNPHSNIYRTNSATLFLGVRF